MREGKKIKEENIYCMISKTWKPDAVGSASSDLPKVAPKSLYSSLVVSYCQETDLQRFWAGWAV
jgi:hypothetical protein